LKLEKASPLFFPLYWNCF